MSAKIGRKNFKALFGADDSDDDNFLADNENAASVEGDNKPNNHKLENKQNSEGLSISSTLVHDVSETEIVSNNETETRKRSSDLNEISSNKKRIKFSEENKELNISKEKVPDSIVMKTDNKKSTDDKKTKSKKMEVGGLVVKLLTPAYVERRFDSRDTFKILARNITHALANKDEQEIREYIKNLLSKNEEFTSQTTL